MIETAVYDTRPYDRHYLQRAPGSDRIRWHFHEFRLRTETAGSARGAQVICVFVNDLLDAEALAGLRNQGLRLVALRCAGFNNVDIKAARDMGLAVTRVPAYSPHAVAEHTVGLLLALNRKIHRAYSRIRELNFSLNGLVGFDIHGKTVGIVGTGQIGRLTARIFRGFDAEVLAYDPFPAADWAAQHQVAYVDLPTLFGRSDVISLHLPLTPETHHLLNPQTFSQMKPGVYIINTSRGKLIQTAALIEGLKTGLVGGVGLDVYEEEEGIFFEDLSGQVLLDDELSRLLTFPNVLITSHQAYLTQEALAEIARVTVANILALESGEPFLPGTVL